MECIEVQSYLITFYQTNISKKSLKNLSYWVCHLTIDKIGVDYFDQRASYAHDCLPLAIFKSNKRFLFSKYLFIENGQKTNLF